MQKVLVPAPIPLTTRIKTNDTMKEIWKDIPGFEGAYQASNLGHIKSLDAYISYCAYDKIIVRKKRGVILSLNIRKDGYLDASLYLNCIRKTDLVHRFIAKTFISNPNNYGCVNHIDCNKINNRIDNLEWCTHKMNSDHAWQNGLHDNHIKGSRVVASKLAESEVVVIKERLRKGHLNKHIALDYNIDPSVISRIKHNKIWKHVD